MVDPIGNAQPFSATGGPSITTSSPSKRPAIAPPFPALPDPSSIGGQRPGPTQAPGIPSLAGGLIVGRISFLLAAWTAIDVDRPTILWAEEPDDLTTGPRFFWNYGEIPLTAQSEMSEHNGIAFLPHAGRWYVRVGGVATDALIIDASAWGTQFKYLSQPGCTEVLQNNITVASAVAATTIATANRNRSAVILQNVPNAAGTSGTVRISISRNTGYLNGLGVGYRLLVNESLRLEEDTLSRGTILAILEAAGSTQIEILEFFDAIHQ